MQQQSPDFIDKEFLRIEENNNERPRLNVSAQGGGSVKSIPVSTPEGRKDLTAAQLGAAIKLGIVIPLKNGFTLKTSTDVSGGAQATRFEGKIGNRFEDARVTNYSLSLLKKLTDGDGVFGIEGSYDPTSDSYSGKIAAKLKFNRGGTMALQEQMSMFDNGGMMDEGNLVDPVSGNSVPVGSLREEVRDDVPAQVSPGELVIPGDVVRYFGLEFFMKLRDEAKQGLARMEDIGQMGNSDTSKLHPDTPFEISDLEMTDNSNTMTMNRGGSIPIPTAEELGDMPSPIMAANGTVVGRPLDTSNLSGPEPTGNTAATLFGPGSAAANKGTDIRKYRGPNGEFMDIPFINGAPTTPIPKGYVTQKEFEKKQKNMAAPVGAKVEPVTVPSSGIGEGVGDEGATPEGISVANMSPAQQASYAQDMNELGIVGDAIIGFFDLMTGAVLNPPLSMQAIGATFASVVGKELKDKELGFISGIASKDRAKAQEMLELRDRNPTAFNAAVEKFNKGVRERTDITLGNMSDFASKAAKDRSFGPTDLQVAAHADAVGRGNAPAGSMANSMGGHSTKGEYGYSTNRDGDVMSSSIHNSMQQSSPSQDTSKGKASTGEVSSGAATDAGSSQTDFGADVGLGGSEAEQMGGGPQTAGEAMGNSPDAPDTPESGYLAKGGLIKRPKRKASKKTKNKKRGLVSRPAIKASRGTFVGSPGEMRFSEDDFMDFARSFRRANLGNQKGVIKLSDFIRLDPESSPENPEYLYTGQPINAYGGWTKNKEGKEIKITEPGAIFLAGRREGQPMERPYIKWEIEKQLREIDESVQIRHGWFNHNIINHSLATHAPAKATVAPTKENTICQIQQQQ